MNAKILFAATLAIALASTLALAGQPQPLSRADVVADWQQARAHGTLRKTDYDFEAHDGAAPRSTSTRDEVIAEMTSARVGNRLIGPMRSRNYNAYGSEIMRTSTLQRAQVRADVLTAMRDGSLRRSDYDDLPVRGLRRPVDRFAVPILAGDTSGLPAGN